MGEGEYVDVNSGEIVEIPVPENVIIERMTKIADQITKVAKGEMVEMEGPQKMTVLKGDGSYSVKPIVAGQEFFYDGAYLGKKGDIIFLFDPVDAQQWVKAEAKWDKVDDFFPLLASKIAPKLGHDGLEDMRDLVEVLLAAEMAAEEEAREKAAIEAQGTKAHALYGRF